MLANANSNNSQSQIAITVSNEPNITGMGLFAEDSK